MNLSTKIASTSQDTPRSGLSKRIIPCLDVNNGRTVKGVQFTDLRDAGDPVELAANYAAKGADELVFLDITATHERRKTQVDLVRAVASVLNIPFTIGGGISSVADAEALLNAGADKISINSAAIKNPTLIEELAKTFGSQFVVVAIDTKHIDDINRVFVNGGRVATSWETEQWVQEVVNLGAGELLVTSMDYDGTKAGFDCNLLRKIDGLVNIPVIASGGAGSIDHFVDLFTLTHVDAALAASVFHFGEIDIKDLKNTLDRANIPIRL